MRLRSVPCRKESKQIDEIFSALVEALKHLAPQFAALLGAAASVTSVMCLAAGM